MRIFFWLSCCRLFSHSVSEFCLFSLDTFDLLDKTSDKYQKLSEAVFGVFTLRDTRIKRARLAGR